MDYQTIIYMCCGILFGVGVSGLAAIAIIKRVEDRHERQSATRKRYYGRRIHVLEEELAAVQNRRGRRLKSSAMWGNHV